MEILGNIFGKLFNMDELTFDLANLKLEAVSKISNTLSTASNMVKTAATANLLSLNSYSANLGSNVFDLIKDLSDLSDSASLSAEDKITASTNAMNNLFNACNVSPEQVISNPCYFDIGHVIGRPIYLSIFAQYNEGSGDYFYYISLDNRKISQVPDYYADEFRGILIRFIPLPNNNFSSIRLDNTELLSLLGSGNGLKSLEDIQDLFSDINVSNACLKQIFQSAQIDGQISVSSIKDIIESYNATDTILSIKEMVAGRDKLSALSITSLIAQLFQRSTGTHDSGDDYYQPLTTPFYLVDTAYILGKLLLNIVSVVIDTVFFAISKIFTAIIYALKSIISACKDLFTKVTAPSIDFDYEQEHNLYLWNYPIGLVETNLSLCDQDLLTLIDEQIKESGNCIVTLSDKPSDIAIYITAGPRFSDPTLTTEPYYYAQPLIQGTQTLADHNWFLSDVFFSVTWTDPEEGLQPEVIGGNGSFKKLSLEELQSVTLPYSDEAEGLELVDKTATQWQYTAGYNVMAMLQRMLSYTGSTTFSWRDNDGSLLSLVTDAAGLNNPGQYMTAILNLLENSDYFYDNAYHATGISILSRPNWYNTSIVPMAIFINMVVAGLLQTGVTNVRSMLLTYDGLVSLFNHNLFKNFLNSWINSLGGTSFFKSSSTVDEFNVGPGYDALRPAISWPSVSASLLRKVAMYTAIAAVAATATTLVVRHKMKQKATTRLAIRESQYAEAQEALQANPKDKGAQKAFYKANKRLTRAWNKAGKAGLSMYNGFSCGSDDCGSITDVSTSTTGLNDTQQILDMLTSMIYGETLND